MVINCAPFNQVILYFQISFFNPKLIYLKLKKSQLVQLLDICDRSQVVYCFGINTGYYVLNRHLVVNLNQIALHRNQILRANTHFV